MRQQRTSLYYKELATGRYAPRAILVDTDPSSIEAVANGKMKELFSQQNLICHSPTSVGNVARIGYTEDYQLEDEAIECARREIELCDCLSGFQFTHSIGGTAGSSIGSRLMDRIKTEYPDRISLSFSVLPSAKLSDTIIEPYNSILAVDQLINNIDQSYLIDNNGLCDMYSSKLGIQAPTYSELNDQIAQIISGITSAFRFQGQPNTNVRKISTNMIPYSRLHFLIPGLSPALRSHTESAVELTLEELSNQLVSVEHCMHACDPRDGFYISLGAVYRGDVTSIEAEEQMVRMTQSSGYFVDWVPNNVLTAVCSVPSRGMRLSLSSIANTTAIVPIFNRILEEFKCLFKKRTLLHWYVGEGIGEMEFEAASLNLQDTISMYSQYCKTSLVEDSDDEVDD